ncbi:MAG: hypothetical protein CL910_01815 [Deltaproteobacteria bacterium]|nr:hypothetical protein [Deltaproteobacteria bacterium]
MKLLVALLVALVLLAWLPSEARLQRRYEVVDRPLPPSPPGLGMERGRHLAESLTLCGHCHGADLGGAEVVALPGLGTLWAPNLTTANRASDRPERRLAWTRALRFGVGAGGRTLVAMPSVHLGVLGPRDLADLLAYLETVPLVHRESPDRRIGPLARLSLSLGRGSDVLSAEWAADRTPRDDTPSPAPNAGYGAYLARIGLCHLCHHEDLSGGLHPLALPGEPEPPDLRRSGPSAAWTLEEFALAMRAGQTPDGRRLDPSFMPWPRYAALSDLEIEALWRYLREP